MQHQTSSSIDYATVGLRVGLEIHRQLDTATKLFCNCPTTLSDQPPSIRFERRLRPTQSELGQIDPAALFEFHKGKIIIYEAHPATTCLVEMDEEPPHPLNPRAVDIALTISLLFKASTLDEIHVMRKIVIDGSNTTGFQRTAVIGLNGKLDVADKEIPVQQVTLEEDAARKIGETKNRAIFHLDRLGVPLIEIATGPVIKDPVEAGNVALAIGQLLRSTRQVKRGLGSIRQDLNVSIENGALVEIKGVQELDLVSKAVEFEVQRQLELLKIRDELRHHKIARNSLTGSIVDVTSLLSGSQSKVVQSALKRGGIVLVVKLPGFKGLLGRELIPGVRLGSEMAKRAAFYGRVGGIFHSDELPAYGLTQSEVDSIIQKLKCGERDAFAVVADDPTNAHDGLNAAIERAREATESVPEETRTANVDGTSQYMRPRPGAARMYPETDVPPVQISRERIDQLTATLPKTVEDLAKEIESSYGMSSGLALQLVDSNFLPTFKEIAGEWQNISPSFLATVMTGSIRELAREGVPVENISGSDIKNTFSLVAEGQTAKESVIDILKWLASHPGSDPKEALDILNLRMLTEPDIEGIVTKIVDSHRTYIEQNAAKAMGKMMNLVMGQVRGKADPELVTAILRKKLEHASS